MRIGKLRVGADAVLCLSTLYLLESSRFLAVVLAAAAVHELGHLLALRLCGAGIREIRLLAAGAEIVWSGALPPGRELVCALAGPAAGLLLALAAARLEGGRVLAGASLALTAFNLLPALPLDGGRAAFGVLNAVFGPCAAAAALKASGLAISAALMAAGVWAARRSGGNISLFAMGLWLAYQTVAKSGEMV